MKLERIYFTEVAERLSRATLSPMHIGHVNILVCGWNHYRQRHGRAPINFPQRVKDNVEWQRAHGLTANRQRFFFSDELELFSRYAGYDLTKSTTDNQ